MIAASILKSRGIHNLIDVSGGFKAHVVMQSKSMFQNITPDFMLRKNDELEVGNSTGVVDRQFASIKFDASYLDSKAIDVYKGPEFEYLSEKQQKNHIPLI